MEVITSRAISAVIFNNGGITCSSPSSSSSSSTSASSYSPSSSSRHDVRGCYSRTFASHELGQTPSSKTTVLLKNVGLDSTLETLQNAITAAEIDHRKIEIQPGCSLHVESEAEAEYIKDKLYDSMDLECTISKTSLPTVLLQNVPESSSSMQQLSQKISTSQVQPVNISTQGATILQISFRNAAEVLDAAKRIRSGSVTLDGHQLQCNTVKMEDGKYVLQIYDLPEQCDIETAKKSFQTLKGSDVLVINGAVKSLVLRVVPKLGTDRPSLKAKIEEILSSQMAGFNNAMFTVATDYKKPSIFLRKIGHCGNQSVKNLLMEYGANKLTMVRYGNEMVKPEFAVAYFDTEDTALEALQKLKSVKLDGRKIASTFKLTSEPACEISNLPADATEESLKKFLLKECRLRPVKISMGLDGQGANTAHLILESPKDIEIARLAFKRKKIMGDKTLKCVAPIDNDDLSIALTSDASGVSQEIVQQIILAIRDLESVEAVDESKWRSNLSAAISFCTLHEANILHAEFAAGSVELDGEDGAKVSSKLIGMPSFAVEVEGHASDQPASLITNSISEDGLVNIIKASRSAIVKFRRHGEVMRGTRKLNSIKLENNHRIKAERFEPQALAGQTEYDVVGPDEEFDYERNLAVLKDFMHANPATRYQIAKFQFENAFKNAQIYADIDFLCDEDAPKHIKDELQNILKPFIRDLEDHRSMRKNPDKSYQQLPDQLSIKVDGGDKGLQRAFELFTQRKEMMKFTYDFDELRALFGAADSSDGFNWAEFRMEDHNDINRLEEEMKDQIAALKAADKEAAMGIGMSITGGSVGKSFKKLENEAKRALEEEKEDAKVEDAHSEFPLAEHEDVDLEADVDEEEKEEDEVAGALDKMGLGTEFSISNGENDEIISLEDVNQVIDREGRVWSGVILDTDMVQKTMPGGRVMSHRCLVMVGNLQGAGGFGVGKGETAQAALRAAFRDALRNLLFIDLYEKAALAHDLHGKHNSCHAYIRATPVSRMMVASPFAVAILKRFGIASASCKLIGRRNPYSQVRAIFNALEKHENLDETAMARGQRYLDLKWLYDNNLA